MTEVVETPKKPRGRKPRPAVIDTNSPEFQAAVAKAASEAVASALAAVKGDLVTQSMTADQGLLRGLATAIAEIGSQGTGKKVVSPEVLRQREDARDRMVDLILAARREGRPATYQLKAQVVIAERLIQPYWRDAQKITHATEIDYWGIPNDAMTPVNDTAKAIHGEFMNSLGSYEKPVRDERLGFTAGGLVVRNGAITRTMQGHGLGEASKEAPPKEVALNMGSDDGLKVHHEGLPGQYKQVPVLGSVHPPALQSV